MPAFSVNGDYTNADGYRVHIRFAEPGFVWLKLGGPDEPDSRAVKVEVSEFVAGMNRVLELNPLLPV